MSARSLREVCARSARAAVPQSPLALKIELCLKQTGCVACHKYGKHCTLGYTCVTFLKAQFDFVGWRVGVLGVETARAVVAQTTERYLMCARKPRLIGFSFPPPTVRVLLSSSVPGSREDKRVLPRGKHIHRLPPTLGEARRGDLGELFPSRALHV